MLRKTQKCWSLKAVNNISKIKILHTWTWDNTNKYAQGGLIVSSDFFTGITSTQVPC